MTAVTYKVKRPCIAGGVYRRPGEVFSMPEMENIPGHLEVVSGKAEKGKAARKPAKPAEVTADNGVTMEDIGGGKPIDVAEITSADIVNK